mgnify:CR=1 FL=1
MYNIYIEICFSEIEKVNLIFKKIRGDSMLDLNELEQLIAFADTGTLSKGGRSIPYFHPISHPFYEKT